MCYAGMNVCHVMFLKKKNTAVVFFYFANSGPAIFLQRSHSASITLSVQKDST